MSSLLHQISNNVIDSLDITEEAEDAFDNDTGSVHDFLDALKDNTSIATARLSGDFLGCLRADARSKVLKALGDDLELTEVTLGDTLLLVEDIIHILAKSPSLQSMSLYSIVLQGSRTHFQILEATVLQHPCLKMFDMSDDCEAAVDGIDLDRVKNTKRSTGIKEMPPPTVSKTAGARSA
jgi:hypothetical protein